MFKCNRLLSRQVSTSSTQALSKKGFASLFSKRKPTPKDLEKYDVIIVGCNLGGILSRHLDKVTHGKYKIMVVYDQSVNQQYPMRPIYEQQRATKTEYLSNARLAINNYTANSDAVGVDKFLPQESSIVLRNGRKIGYDQLVIAMGLKEDLDSIKGFEDAWKDPEHPVFASKDHPSWRSILHKYTRWHYNFTYGDAYFVIPPYPFKGEIGAYNFFVSRQVWNWFLYNGKLSPKHSFTIVNANQRFSQWLDSADTFIKQKIAKMGIKVEYGLRITEVDMKTSTATFQNIETKESNQREYQNLYVIPPCKPHESLVESGLATKESNYMLDVDHKTLRHNKYKNIFGLGDINNLPTTKSFWAGFYQIHVVRNNVYRSLKGQTLNALYDGYSKCALIVGQNKLTYVCHYYDQKETWHNLLGSNGGIIGTIRYLYYAKNQKKKFLDYYLEKDKGPPYFKFLPTFKELPADQSTSKTDIASTASSYFAVNKNVQEVVSDIGKGKAQVGETARTTAEANTTQNIKQGTA